MTYEEAYFLAADKGAVIGVNGHLHDYFEKIYLLQGKEPPLTGFTPTMLVTHYIYTHFQIRKLPFSDTTNIGIFIPYGSALKEYLNPTIRYNTFLSP